jgi:hypothetical protein
MKRIAGSWPGREFLAHRGLITLSAGAPMLEAALLCWLAPSARSLAGQLTAVPPLAVFHDVRWLYGYNRPWFEFAVLLSVVIAMRSALNATLIRLAWPAGRPRPTFRAALRPAVTLAMAACVLLSPIAALTVGVAILPFSWPFLAALAVMLLISLPLSHGGSHPTWWRTLPPIRAMYWLLADFALLSMAAAVIGGLPVAAAVPISGLAGLANARAWVSLARVAAHQPARQPDPHGPWLPVPLTPVATMLAIASVIGMTRLAFVLGRGPQPVSVVAAAMQPGAVTGTGGLAAGQPARGTTGPGHSTRDPVLVIRGFGSTCCATGRSLQSLAPGTLVQQFSYRGMTRTGQPLPQGSGASDLPLPQLGNRIAAQVWRLHEETGRPVDILAESEGTLGVDAMLATHPGLPLGSMVMMSPIVAPGRVGYPASNGTGPGPVPASELRAMVWFVGRLSPFGSSGAQTLIRSVDEVGARFAASAAQHRSLRTMFLVPLADAVTLPVCPLPPDVFVVPALHGDLTGAPGVKQMVRGFFAHKPVREAGQYKATAEIVAAAAAAWRLPETTASSLACGK